MSFHIMQDLIRYARGLQKNSLSRISPFYYENHAFQHFFYSVKFGHKFESLKICS